ncbi:hypothetical protein AA313_de0208164 [Arthrobotrys entomopaga]|nr:hypothetical protein AA313_de0208164 [Arthrobotrys entomopaga]
MPSSPSRLYEGHTWGSRSDRGSFSGSSSDGNSQPIPMIRPAMSLRKLSVRSIHGTIHETTPPASPSSFTSTSASARSVASSSDVLEWRAKRSVNDSAYFSSNHSNSADSLRTTVRFSQDCRLCLIHIPRDLYPHFLQPILKLVLPIQDSRKNENSHLPTVDEEEERYYSHTTNGYQHSDGSSDVGQAFVNVSITPVECSVVCAYDTAQELFQPLLDALEPERRETVVISEDEYVVIQVDGEGFDAGQRVLELTSPLAMAGVKPDFLSVTLTDTEPPSFLLERQMLHLFGPNDTLLGNKHEVLIPIMLDFRDIPVESTGIVCGVAGRLCGEHGSFLGRSDPVDMSYLSTARAGTVMVAEDDIERAMAALQF